MARPWSLKFGPPVEGPQQWLHKTNHTQAWLADELGISGAAVSRIARGVNFPHPITALAITRITGITSEALLRAKLAYRPEVQRARRAKHARRLIERGSQILVELSEAKGVVMIAPDVEWDRFPITLRVPHVAEIYGMKPDTLRKQIRYGDPSLPVPFMDKPWRWRKAEVRRCYERLTLRDVRQGRARLRRDVRMSA